MVGYHFIALGQNLLTLGTCCPCHKLHSGIIVLILGVSGQEEAGGFAGSGSLAHDGGAVFSAHFTGVHFTVIALADDLQILLAVLGVGTTAHIFPVLGRNSHTQCVAQNALEGLCLGEILDQEGAVGTGGETGSTILGSGRCYAVAIDAHIRLLVSRNTQTSKLQNGIIHGGQHTNFAIQLAQLSGIVIEEQLCLIGQHIALGIVHTVNGNILQCQIAGLLIGQSQLIVAGCLIPANAVAAHAEAHIEPPLAHEAVLIAVLLLESAG